jgi:hypothetical protein
MGLIKVILKETLFYCLDEEGFNKIEAFSAHKYYLEIKKCC